MVQVTGRRPQGDIRFEDVRDRIREQLGQQLAVRRYIDRLRRATYVDMRVGRRAGVHMTRLAITLGDPRGIGPEIVAEALAPPLAAEITLVGAEDQIDGLPAARRVGVGTWGLGSGERAGGSRADHPGGSGGGARGGDRGQAGARGEVDAIVTAPAHKHALHLAGFPYPGHTEWLAKLAGDVDVAMMLAHRPSSGGAGDDARALLGRAGAAHDGPGDSRRTDHAAALATGSASRPRGWRCAR